jgi:hypothetical protein
MSNNLPIASTPSYNLTIPSSGEKIIYRPYLVKEEKALLLAEQSEDLQVIVDTMKTVISACVKTKGFDVSRLAIFDLEYILMNIRSKSVGEISEVNIPCSSCGAVHQVAIDLSKVEVKKHPDHKQKIQLFDQVGIVMKYPSIDILTRLEDDNDVTATFDATIDCIDYIYDESNIYYAKDRTRQELIDFVENLNSESFKSIEDFFLTMPELEVKAEFKCIQCNTHNEKILEGLQNFL